VKFLIKLLPKEYQALITLGTRIMSSFDTKEKAMEFFEVVAESLKDGHVTVAEWSRIGSKSGVFKRGPYGPRKGGKK